MALKFRSPLAREGGNAAFYKMHEEGPEKFGYTWLKVNQHVVEAATSATAEIQGFDSSRQEERYLLTKIAWRICVNIVKEKKSGA